jgi:hypothetical protein
LISDAKIPTLDRAGLRNFGLVTGGMFVALFGLLFPWLLSFSYPVWPWIILAVLGGTGLVLPNLLKPVHYWWMRFAVLLSRITTPIILGILYFLMITPMGLVMRMFGKDPMKRAFVDDDKTYRSESIARESVDLEKPF